MYLYNLLFLVIVTKYQTRSRLVKGETRFDSSFEVQPIIVGKAGQQELPANRPEIAACSQFSGPESLLTAHLAFSPCPRPALQGRVPSTFK